MVFFLDIQISSKEVILEFMKLAFLEPRFILL